MSYLTVKKIKGNYYLYEVHSERDGTTVRQVFDAYHGRADGSRAAQRRASFVSSGGTTVPSEVDEAISATLAKVKPTVPASVPMTKTSPESIEWAGKTSVTLSDGEVIPVPQVRKEVANPKTGQPYETTLFRGVSSKGGATDEGMYGKGTYYTTDPNYAKNYTEELVGGKVVQTGKVLEHRVRLENPFIATSSQLDNIGRPAFEEARKAGKNYKEADEIKSQAIRNELEKQGYDGIVLGAGVRNEISEAQTHEVVVFHPEKSVKELTPATMETATAPEDKPSIKEEKIVEPTVVTPIEKETEIEPVVTPESTRPITKGKGVTFSDNFSKKTQTEVVGIVGNLPPNLKLDINEFYIDEALTKRAGALAIYYPETKTIIFRNEAVARNPNTIAHELAHHAVDSKAVNDYTKIVKARAEGARETFAEDFGDYISHPNTLSKESLAFFETRYPKPVTPIKTDEKPQLTKITNEDIYNYQNTVPEKTIHTEWDTGNSFRYDLEGAGDILRELTKSHPAESYLGEKIERLQRLLKTEDKFIDRYGTANQAASDKLNKLISEYEKQPTLTPEQSKAKELILSLARGQYKDSVKRLDELSKSVLEPPATELPESDLSTPVTIQTVFPKIDWDLDTNKPKSTDSRTMTALEYIQQWHPEATSPEQFPDMANNYSLLPDTAKTKTITPTVNTKPIEAEKFGYLVDVKFVGIKDVESFSVDAANDTEAIALAKQEAKKEYPQRKLVSVRPNYKEPLTSSAIPKADIPETKEATWFHGTHSNIKELSPRSVEQVKTIDTIGTWVTGSPEKARLLYGENILEVKETPPNLLEAHTDNFDDFFYSNKNLFENLFPNKDVALLEDFKGKGLARKDKALFEMRTQYLQAFRKMLEDAGYNGIIWKNSRIDLAKTDTPHDVAVFFHHQPLKGLEA